MNGPPPAAAGLLMPSPAYLRFRRRLLTGLLMMAALAVTVVMSQLRVSQIAREKAVQQQTEHFVQAMEAHVLYAIQFADLSLRGYANAIKALPPDKVHSHTAISELLSSRQTQFNDNFWIAFIAADGKAVASSNGLEIAGTYYGDRDYFQAHVHPQIADQLYVGGPVIGRQSGQKVFFLSRRVETRDHRFLGVIVAPLDATRFSTVFDNSRFSPDVSIALVHRSGKVIARAPAFEKSFNADLSQAPLFENVRKARAGTYHSTSRIDQVARIFSYQVFDSYPLIMVVGSADVDANRWLDQNSLMAAGGLGLLLALMLAGGHFALRSFARVEERELRYRQLYAASREMEEKLSHSEQRLRLVTDNLPVMIAHVDQHERYQFTNRRFDETYGIPYRSGPGRSVIDVAGPRLYPQEHASLLRALAGETLHFERMSECGQRVRWEGVTCVPDKNPEGMTSGVFLMVEDITERRKNEESMKLAALMYQNSAEGMMVTDAAGHILSVNPAFTRISGYAESEVLGRQAYELSSSRQDRRSFNRIRHAIYHSGQWEGEIWHQHKDGGHYLVALRFNTVFDENGKVFRLVALFSDITKKKASEELIWRQANFDTLTGLPNRRMFQEHLRLEMKKTDRSHLPMALVFIDLDHFKEINDTLGHDKGDILLKEAASRLTRCVRGTDIVSRLGGDEFTVILSELRNAGDVVRIAQEILKKASEPFDLAGELAHVSASIGITLYPDDGADAETLLKNADQAMYTAKQQGRNRFNYFAPFMQEASRARTALSNELRQAIQREELRILFQPIINLSTGKICKAEALVRWQHPQRGLMYPSEFIPIAESSGLIVAMGDWVFRQAAQQARRMQELGCEDFQVCVNKSSWQFRDDSSSYQQWLEVLANLKLDANKIIIEVTESLLLDPAHAIGDKLRAFQHAGMQVSLDDFGTGYCSVAFLKRFNIDYIKIDPAFVCNLVSGTDGVTLCSAVIALAHKLGIQVIAEGIETQQQMQALKQVGCDFGQGYLFSQPISRAELEKNMELGTVAVDN